MVAFSGQAVSEEPFFAEDPVQLDIGFGSPHRQSRVTIAFRILLAVPHFIVLYFLGLVGSLLLIGGWFAALVLGRLPGWIARYQMGLIAYSTRVNAYALLLADKFPPFGFSAAGYSIDVEIGASRLSRLKVFFRWLLFIPVAIGLYVASIGLFVLSPVIWFITLVLGRMPQPFFAAVAAVVRYQARYSAYMSLVTDEYPRRLWGDDKGWAPDGFRLSLAGGAEWVMRVIVLLGIALFIAAPFVTHLSAESNQKLVAAELRFEGASQNYIDAARACKTLDCLETHGLVWGQAFQAFSHDLSSLANSSFSPGNAAKAELLSNDAHQLGQALIAASYAKTVSGYEKAFRKVQRLTPAFEADATSLLGHRL
jgi:Domain of unknown function (DUF4389)